MGKSSPSFGVSMMWFCSGSETDLWLILMGSSRVICRAGSWERSSNTCEEIHTLVKMSNTLWCITKDKLRNLASYFTVNNDHSFYELFKALQSIHKLFSFYWLRQSAWHWSGNPNFLKSFLKTDLLTDFLIQWCPIKQRECKMYIKHTSAGKQWQMSTIDF